MIPTAYRPLSLIEAIERLSHQRPYYSREPSIIASLALKQMYPEQSLTGCSRAAVITRSRCRDEDVRARHGGRSVPLGT